MTARPASLSDRSPVQGRGRSAVLLFFLLLILVVRLATAFGERLHFDEPNWLIRGDFLVGALLTGDWDALQNQHWTIAGLEGRRRIFNSYRAAGTGTAVVTGFGRLLMPLVSSCQGVDRVLAEIALSRLFQVCCSVLTVFLLLFLSRRLGLPWAGQLSLLFYLIFDPILRDMGSRAHLESFLTLTVPVSLLLYGLSRYRDSLPLCAAAGVIFGLGFANRLNAGVVVVAAIAYAAWRILFFRADEESLRLEIRHEAARFGLFCLTGWGVFVLCFPPLWQSPVLGFADFLYQQTLLTGGGPVLDAPPLLLWSSSKLRFVFVVLSVTGFFLKPVRSSRVFQLGALLFVFGVVCVSLPGKFYSRYLSSALPGLALTGSCTLAYALDRWGRRPAYLPKVLGTGLLLLSTWLTGSITWAQWDHFRKARGFYGQLHAQNFSRIDVPSISSSFHRSEGSPPDRVLLVRSSNDHLQLFYLGALLSDRRLLEETRPGWTRQDLESRFRCAQGSWRLADLSPRNLEAPHAVRYGRLIAWPCGGGAGYSGGNL